MKLAYAITAPDISGAFMGLTGPLYGNLTYLAETGYDGVELFVRNPFELDPFELEEKLATANLLISCLGTTHLTKMDGLSLLSKDEYIRRTAIGRMKDIVMLANRLKTSVSIGKSRGSREGLTNTQWKRYLGEALKELCEYAGPNVNILIEAQNQTNIDTLNTIEETIEFIDSLSYPNLKLHIDTYHLDITETDPTAAIKKCKGYLGYIHCADSDRQIPGSGSIDLVTMLSTCKEIGYDSWIGLEISQGSDPNGTALKAYHSLSSIVGIAVK